MSSPRWLRAVMTFAAAVLVVVAPPPAPAAAAAEAEELFDATNVWRLALQLEPAAVKRLRQRSDHLGDRIRVEGTVIEGGRTYTNVSFQLKGYSSFQSIDSRPSFTLKFDRHIPGQRFHGLEKISLNNSLQDPTRLHELLARNLFAAAHVPVARATLAVVELNGRNLGFYVLTEGFDQRFLARHFDPTAGALYEGGTLQDFDGRPRLASGTEPAEDPSPRRRLINAARLPDPAARYAALAELLDLDRFLSQTALETILCHSDSYSMNRNNYRVFYQANTERFTFIPHGLDRILGAHRSGLDLSLVPPQLGLISRALLSTEPGRQQYLQRLATLVTNVFQPNQLTTRVRTWDRLLNEAEAAGLYDRDGQPARLEPRPPNSAADLCLRIQRRAADLQLQLESLAPALARPAIPVFDDANQYVLDQWQVRPFAGRPSATLERRAANGRVLLIAHAQPTTNDFVAVTLWQRLTLPAGRYHLRGGWSCFPADRPIKASAYLQRGARERFQLRREALDWQAMDEEIEVARGYAPEEIDLFCEFRTVGPVLRLDPTQLRLVRTSNEARPSR